MKVTSVHVIPEEEIVGLGGKTSVLEQPQKVGILAMDITWEGFININLTFKTLL